MSDEVKGKIPYTEPDSPINVEITEPKTKISFKTTIEFHDKDKGKRIELSVPAPNITPSNCLQFLTADSLIHYPMPGIFRFEVKQVVEKKEAKVEIKP